MPQGAGGTGTGMQDPLGALQTLARQGTGNNQVMGMAGVGPNSQGMVPQQANNASNCKYHLKIINKIKTSLCIIYFILFLKIVLQSLNRPGPPGMNIQNMQNKMQGIGMMSGQGGQGGVPMGHMSQMQNMQGGGLINPMNQMVQGNMPQQLNPMSQMVAGQMQQNIPNQMQGQLQTQLNNQAGQMNTNNNNNNNNNMQNVVGQNQLNQMGQVQIVPGQMQQQMQHMQRKPVEMMNAGFPRPRNVTPNQFLRQSPSPLQAPSPAGGPTSNQMVLSPALVPSPSPQHSMMSGQQRSIGMVPSPSSSLNTPGGVGPAASPQEEQAYYEKIRQLSKYIEPIKKFISTTGHEGDLSKLNKMKKLLEILLSPAKISSLDVIIKCELVLEKQFRSKIDIGVSGVSKNTGKEHYFFTPLIDAVNSHLQSPVANHTLQRTFGPCLEALFGPEIKGLPQPLKKHKPEETLSEIPDVLQGEIARLDQRFKVSLDPAQQNGSKCIQLICWLDDRHLPCVPPVSVTVPSDYPLTPPRCIMAPHEYATTFLSAVQKALDARITKLPKRYSLSQLLDTWEMSVRQASAPVSTPAQVSTTSVLMGL